MTVTILQGDALTVLKTMPDESVNCCVTSPPYWGLRDYGTSKWEGGDAKCEHPYRAQIVGSGALKRAASLRDKPFSICPKCGACRIDAQLGLERTPKEYVSKMVEVFREVRRVLRGDGTLWLNLGDSYHGSMKGSNGDGTWQDRSNCKQGTNKGALNIPPTKASEIGLKPKDLVGIPWMVAFALRADGWYLRQDIIWSKPNPMPESVRDRCTKSHEYIFLMSKSQMYFYDAEAICEPASSSYNGGTLSFGRIGPQGWKGKTKNETMERNRRSVWTVSTAPFPGAHFATFPPKLIEPCILAGCPQGGTVLDPFGGSGTVGMVAEQNGRNSILIELNPKYVEMAKRRTAQTGLFCGVTA